MSQRTFRSGDRFVYAGWAVEKKYYFVNIQVHDDNVMRPIFDTWRDRPPGKQGMTLEEISSVLGKHNIDPPATFYRDLINDAIENSCVNYDYDSDTDTRRSDCIEFATEAIDNMLAKAVQFCLDPNEVLREVVCQSKRRLKGV